MPALVVRALTLAVSGPVAEARSLLARSEEHLPGLGPAGHRPGPAGGRARLVAAGGTGRVDALVRAGGRRGRARPAPPACCRSSCPGSPWRSGAAGSGLPPTRTPTTRWRWRRRPAGGPSCRTAWPRWRRSKRPWAGPKAAGSTPRGGGPGPANRARPSSRCTRRSRWPCSNWAPATPAAAVRHLEFVAGFAADHELGDPVLLNWAGDLAEALDRSGDRDRARAVCELVAAEAEPGPAGRRNPRSRRAAAPCWPMTTGRRRSLRGGVRLARAGGSAVPGGADPAAARRAAAPAPPARRRAGRAEGRTGRVRAARRRAMGGPGAQRAAGHRGDRPATSSRPAAAHPAGAAGRPGGGGRCDQRRGGGSAVPVREDGRVPPVRRVPQTRHPVPRPAVRALANAPEHGRVAAAPRAAR